MRRRLLLVFVAMLAAAGWQLGAASQGTAAGDRQLAAARHKATVEGDLKGAIGLYRQIVAGANDNRALAAQALLGMAECYQRLGDAEARKIYEEILRKSGQQNAANVARERLGRAKTGNPPEATERYGLEGTSICLARFRRTDDSSATLTGNGRAT